jgi:apolipoprotein N-acyltransferase
MIILFFCGILKYYNKNSLKNTDQVVTIVQPNIKQKNKWILKNREQHLNNLLELSTKYRNSFNNKNRIIIWPETSFEGSIPSETKLLSNISKKILKNKNTTLILGLLRTDEKKVFNSLVFVNSDGDIIHNYDKIKLVPFGEYIPFRQYLGALTDMLAPKDFTSGKLKSNPTIYGFENIITLICYEILFTNEIVKRLSKNTNLLINITNDAWFGKTIGPYQHLALAKIKAVEFGLPLARVANTGISAYVSPYGEIIGRIPLDIKGVKTFDLIPALDSTLYKIYGEYIFVFLILILLVINIIYNLNFKEEKLNEK